MTIQREPDSTGTHSYCPIDNTYLSHKPQSFFCLESHRSQTWGEEAHQVRPLVFNTVSQTLDIARQMLKCDSGDSGLLPTGYGAKSQI